MSLTSRSQSLMISSTSLRSNAQSYMTAKPRPCVLAASRACMRTVFVRRSWCNWSAALTAKTVDTKWATNASLESRRKWQLWFSSRRTATVLKLLHQHYDKMPCMNPRELRAEAGRPYTRRLSELFRLLAMHPAIHGWDSTTNVCNDYKTGLLHPRAAAAAWASPSGAGRRRRRSDPPYSSALPPNRPAMDEPAVSYTLTCFTRLLSTLSQAICGRCSDWFDRPISPASLHHQAVRMGWPGRHWPRRT